MHPTLLSHSTCHPRWLPVFPLTLSPSLKHSNSTSLSHAPGRFLYIVLWQYQCSENFLPFHLKISSPLTQQEAESTCCRLAPRCSCSSFQGNMFHWLKNFFLFNCPLPFTFAWRCAVWVRTLSLQVTESNLSAFKPENRALRNKNKKTQTNGWNATGLRKGLERELQRHQYHFHHSLLLLCASFFSSLYTSFLWLSVADCKRCTTYELRVMFYSAGFLRTSSQGDRTLGLFLGIALKR